MLLKFHGRKLNRSPVTTAFLTLFLLLIGVFMALPVVYAFVSAFKPMEEFYLFPPRFFVQNPTLDNFVLMSQLMSNMWVPFERYLFNTVIMSLSSTLIYILIASLAAYPLAKHRFPGRAAVKNLIVTALMFTTAVTGVSQYVIMAYLKIINTPWALLLPSLAGTMGVFLCMQNLSVIPDEMLESGRMDGAGEYRIWWRLVLPNIKPVLATMCIFQFQSVWNQNGGLLIYDETLKPLSMALSQITSSGLSRAGADAAAALLLLIPPVLVFIVAQSKVMETMVNSGIKG